MQTLHTIADLRRVLSTRKRIAFVPTMGNLHQGHLDLVATARTQADTVVASIFVNRLQFAPNEDFDRYPRTLTQDVASLTAAGCDLAFAPDEHELYPEAQRFQVAPPPEIADILEGAFRPGFFTGVATVVHKLFNIVQPQVAIFGKKDYQHIVTKDSKTGKWNAKHGYWKGIVNGTKDQAANREGTPDPNMDINFFEDNRPRQNYTGISVDVESFRKKSSSNADFWNKILSLLN